MPGHVHHVVDAAQQPDRAVQVIARAVTGEVPALLGEPGPVGLLEPFRIPRYGAAPMLHSRSSRPKTKLCLTLHAMDTLTFISKFLEHGAWPAAAVVIIVLLRSQLQELIPMIKKLKAGPVEVELERVVKELEKTKQVAAAADAKASVVAAKFEEGEDESEKTTPETSPEALINTNWFLFRGRANRP